MGTQSKKRLNPVGAASGKGLAGNYIGEGAFIGAVVD
jgi:hypothetical protein